MKAVISFVTAFIKNAYNLDTCKCSSAMPGHVKEEKAHNNIDLSIYMMVKFISNLFRV
jgi:hypothetical protein